MEGGRMPQGAVWESTPAEVCSAGTSRHRSHGRQTWGEQDGYRILNVRAGQSTGRDTHQSHWQTHPSIPSQTGGRSHHLPPFDTRMPDQCSGSPFHPRLFG